MTVAARVLIKSKYASTAVTQEYLVPAVTKVIIDKFTATNVSASAATLSVYLVPSGETLGSQHLIIQTLSVAAAATKDFSELQNQILEAADTIHIQASAATSLVIRAGGRVIT